MGMVSLLRREILDKHIYSDFLRCLESMPRLHSMSRKNLEKSMSQTASKTPGLLLNVKNLGDFKFYFFEVR